MSPKVILWLLFKNKGLYFGNSKSNNLTSIQQYNKFLQSIKNYKKRFKGKNQKAKKNSKFHPNNEINELIKIIVNLKSDDPEHIKFSRILKEALFYSKPKKSKHISKSKK